MTLVLGCVTTPEPTASFPVAEDPKVLLKPGDVLEVKFLYWPELNENSQAIRPDGKISLQLVGDVIAEGMEPEELRQSLLTQYEDKLREPEISVVVRSLDSHRVYVGGEVYSPGLVPIQGRLTALEAVMQAGGPRKDSARLSTVVIIRQSGNQQYATTIDMREMLESPETANFELAPRDIVYVPRTNIDKVDQWVEQYINKIIPRNLHFQYTFSHTDNLDDDDDASRNQRAADLLSTFSNVSANVGEATLATP
ncbi:MAG: hypothetical protein AMXMBFR84_30210 [Candidatus Hydrogenedentota bacterium]